MTFVVDELSVPVNVRMHSLIGPGHERPTRWGNYFWTEIDGKDVRVLNMWSENLEAAENRFLHDGLVRVRRYRDVESGGLWCLIIDERIPPEWFHNKLCFTGGRMPTAEIGRDMYDYLGDPDDEFEQFVNPRSYYEKRGWTYHDNGRFSSISKQYG